MITEIYGVKNSKVIVFLDKEYNTITVQDCWSAEFTCFAEFADMKELFEWFKESMNEATDYESAMQFFKPKNLLR